MDSGHKKNEPWKWSYTAVLVANAIYIIIFYFITSSFS